MRHIGFTGTRHGMTDIQDLTVSQMLRERIAEWRQGLYGHHGDCMGADAAFHALCRRRSIDVVVHPPIEVIHRAFCPVTEFDQVREPLPYLERNAAIVRESDVMIACPAEPTEQPRGGTWATIRMARKAGKPLAIVLPDGTVQRERWV